MAKNYTTATLWYDDCEPEALPPVCAKCGEPAVGEKKVRFSWQPPWVIATILLGLLIYVIMSLVLTKRRTAYMPVCEDHGGLWTRANLIALSVLFGFFVLMVGGLVVASQPGMDQLTAPVVVGSVLFLLVGIVAAAVVQAREPKATLITDDKLRVKNLSPVFVEALEDQQDREEDEYRARRAAKRAARQRYEAD